MAKPPKIIPKPSPSDSTSTTTRPNSDNTLSPGNPVTIGHPDSHLPGRDIPPGTHPSDASPESNPSPKPAIIITDIPVPGRPSSEFPADMIIYKPHLAKELIPLGNSGLSLNSEGLLYAHIENVGDVVIRINAKGQYEIETASQHLMTLQKIEGKPLWQKKNHSSDPTETDGGVPVPASRQPMSLDELVIPKKYARTLTEPDTDGIRRDNKGRKYVDLENNTTVMIIQTQSGKYQATNARDRNPISPVLERIEGTTRWRAGESGPGPSKRPRLEEPADTVHTAARPGSVASSWEPNPYLWLTWGKSTSETTGSIEVDGRHYKVFDFNKDVESGAIIKDPELGETFTHLEHVLSETPWRQPVAAYRNDAGRWSVSSPPLFNRSLSQSVAGSFKDFTTITSENVANGLFAHSNRLSSTKPSSRSLLELSATLHHWKNRSTERHSGPTDPLQLLPISQTDSLSGRELLALSSTDIKTLHRLDFDNKRFAQEWSQFKTKPDAAGLRQLFQILLTRNGYEVFPLTNDHQGGVLVFKRTHQLYFIKLDISKGQSALYDLPTDLNNPHLVAGIGDEAHKALIAANERNDVIWLKGGIHQPETGQEAVFIIRAAAPVTTIKNSADEIHKNPRLPSPKTVWNGRWQPDEGGAIQPFALRNSKYAIKFKLDTSSWVSHNPFYPFVGEVARKGHYEALLARGPEPLREATNVNNIKQKIEAFTQWGMKIDIHSLPFFKLPGQVAMEVKRINGGLIADLVNLKSNGQAAVQRIIEPMAGSGFYANYARAVGFEGEIIINDINPLISWTQKEIIKQPDRVKHYIDFIKNDLVSMGKQNGFEFDPDNLAVTFKSEQESKEFSARDTVKNFRDEVRNYFDEVMDVVVETKNGEVVVSEPTSKGASVIAKIQDDKIVISAPPPGSDEKAFLAAVFYTVQNNNRYNNGTVEIKKLVNGKYSLHLPISVMVPEGKSIKLLARGMTNTHHLNYISYLHESATHPTSYSNEDGWKLLDNTLDKNNETRNQSDLIILSGHFSDVYLTEANFMKKIEDHVTPLSEKEAKIIITNSYSESKETAFNALGFHTFKKSRKGKAKRDYLLAINKPALQAALSLEISVE